MVYFAYFVVYLFIFLLGVCIGSFLNVLIYRIPQKIPAWKGRSFCPHCGKTLKPYDMVPVVSFLVLKGKCRFCREKISPRYLLVEVLSGVLAMLSVLFFGFAWPALLAFAVCAVLVAVVFIDLDTMEIPNKLVIALAVLAVSAVWAFPEVPGLNRVIGLFVLSVPMLLMNLIIPDSFGGGDIKLIAAGGFLLGWQNALVAGFVALITGGAFAVYLLKAGKKGRKDHFAFGPFLALGIVTALFAGELIIRAYLALFSLSF